MNNIIYGRIYLNFLFLFMNSWMLVLPISKDLKFYLKLHQDTGKFWFKFKISCILYQFIQSIYNYCYFTLLRIDTSCYILGAEMENVILLILFYFPTIRFIWNTIFLYANYRYYNISIRLCMASALYILFNMKVSNIMARTPFSIYPYVNFL